MKRVRNKKLAKYILTLLTGFLTTTAIIWTSCYILGKSFCIELPIIAYLMCFMVFSVGNRIMDIKKDTTESK